MADTTISALPSASAVASTDVLPMDIAAAGATQKATTQQLVNSGLLAPGAIGSTTPSDATFNNLTANTTLHAGNVGTEGSGINVNGLTYTSSFKVSDIDGSNNAQTILHKHSTTAEPLIVAARSNSDTTGHGSITAGQQVFSLYGTGWETNNYKIFGALQISADSTGTLSSTSAPGRVSLQVTPNGAVYAADALVITNDYTATFTGNVASVGYQLASSGIITESGTTRTLSATDNGKVIYCTSASAVTITTAVSLGAGFSCTIIQGGAGQITVAQGASTTLVSYGSLVKTAGQYALASIICPVANTFYLAGNLGA